MKSKKKKTRLGKKGSQAEKEREVVVVEKGTHLFFS
jgi:hypothetical protein